MVALPTTFPCYVKAKYSWSGEEKNDLGFIEGDVIEVLNTGDGSWWMGRLKRNKMVGSFPSNFVELIDMSRSKSIIEAAAERHSRSPSPANSVQGKPRSRSHSPAASVNEQMARVHPSIYGGSPSPAPMSREPSPNPHSVPRERLLSDLTDELNASDANLSKMRRSPSPQPGYQEPAMKMVEIEVTDDEDEMDINGAGSHIHRSHSHEPEYRSSSRDLYRSSSREPDYRSSSRDLYRSSSREPDYRSSSREPHYRSNSTDVYRSNSREPQFERSNSYQSFNHSGSQNSLNQFHVSHGHGSIHRENSNLSQRSNMIPRDASGLSQASMRRTDSGLAQGHHNRQSSINPPLSHRASFISTPIKREPDLEPEPADPGYTYVEISDSESEEDDDSPPPMPPPHSLPPSPVKQTPGHESRTPQAPRHGQPAKTPSPSASSLKLDRTPSPLRNAMDDVMESLENMHFRGGSPSFRSNSNKSSVTAVDDEAPPAKFITPAHKSNASVTTVDVTSELNRSQDSFDSSYAPFDPESYHSLNNSPERSTAKINRTDTFDSLHSAISASNSTHFNQSFTQPAPANFDKSIGSITSAASLARRKDTYSMDLQRTGSEIITEVPVKLPNDQTSTPVKKKSSLKFKRSAGFLSRIFNSSTSEKNQQSPAAEGATQLTRSHSAKSNSSSKRSLGSLKSSLSKTFKFGRSSKPSDILSDSWIEVRRDVNRANSVTENERRQRRHRLELEGRVLIEPVEVLAQRQGNETIDGGATRGDGRHDPRSRDFTHVDAAMFAMHAWPQMMTPGVFASSRIGRQFDYDLDRLRAVFDFCAAKISLERSDHANGSMWDEYDDEEQAEDYEQEFRSSFRKVMTARVASRKELAYCFKDMCDALDIPCQVIAGHLKTPGEIWDRPGVPPTVNHYWNAVIIDDEWRIVDSALANITFPNREAYYRLEKSDGINHFYFLATPMEIIYTHVPLNPHEQHVVPPLEYFEAMNLPLAGPASIEHSLRLVDYHNGLTRLSNFDVAEICVSVPHGVEMSADVLIGNVGVSSGYDDPARVPALAQPFWENNRRYYRVKALLPEGYARGVLNMYAGKVANNAVTPNLPIAYSLPITHSGQNAPYEFVTRHPTPQCRRQDIYVVQPQIKKLVSGNLYQFCMRQHPAGGITAGSGFSQVKLAIQSPSGKITKLYRKGGSESSVVFGAWENSVKCNEIGSWRGLVLSDRGNSWSVFAEWYCI
uniref:ARAD1A06534p n=1 Tax=Blastobotrys adeninivorans TaxID=409370 RepID=A0A060SX57_BLAAD